MSKYKKDALEAGIPVKFQLCNVNVSVFIFQLTVCVNTYQFSCGVFLS